MKNFLYFILFGIILTGYSAKSQIQGPTTAIVGETKTYSYTYIADDPNAISWSTEHGTITPSRSFNNVYNATVTWTTPGTATLRFLDGGFVVTTKTINVN